MSPDAGRTWWYVRVDLDIALPEDMCLLLIEEADTAMVSTVPDRTEISFWSDKQNAFYAAGDVWARVGRVLMGVEERHFAGLVVMSEAARAAQLRAELGDDVYEAEMKNFEEWRRENPA